MPTAPAQSCRLAVTADRDSTHVSQLTRVSEGRVTLRLARDYAAQARTASGANMLLGIWLIVSPWVFYYSGRSAVLSSVSVGTLIALLAVSRLASLHNSAALSGINLVLASWTVYSPWAYGYATNECALLDNVLVGILVAALAIWSATATDAEQRQRAETTVR